MGIFGKKYKTIETVPEIIPNSSKIISQQIQQIESEIDDAEDDWMKYVKETLIKLDMRISKLERKS